MKSPLLMNNGLNLQAVFNLSELPESVMNTITEHALDLSSFKQLILLGHGGRRMWESLQHSEFADADHPVDHFSVDLVQRYFAEACRGRRYRIIYPCSKQLVPLQKLGELAGWHHASPFRVGVNEYWGSWFAYRAVVVADTEFVVTSRLSAPSPCEACSDKPCVSGCPANALSGNEGSLKPCVDYRLAEHSLCKDRCFSRMACPVASEHRYTMEQVNYHYTRSMQTIEEYYPK